MAITINGSTGISGVDGSTGTPAIIGSDADTGLVFSAGRVQASLNGTSANVGLVSGTAQASTSGTSIDFTGIPSWAKRITVMFSGVSTNGTSGLLVQIGAGSVTTSGYTSISNELNNSSVSAGATSTAGFNVKQGNAAQASNGHTLITLVGSNLWVASHVYGLSSTNVCLGGGNVTLSGTLDRVRVTSINGTDTFDAGTINILYE